MNPTKKHPTLSDEIKNLTYRTVTEEDGSVTTIKTYNIGAVGVMETENTPRPKKKKE
jgi:hypothetical protein